MYNIEVYFQILCHNICSVHKLSALSISVNSYTYYLDLYFVAMRYSEIYTIVLRKI